jgi:hypothetical protein
MRPGRIDRKIEIPLPNEVSRMEILKIHCGPIRKVGEIDYEAIVKLSDGFNGAGGSLSHSLRVTWRVFVVDNVFMTHRFAERMHGSWYVCDPRRPRLHRSR